MLLRLGTETFLTRERVGDCRRDLQHQDYMVVRIFSTFMNIKEIVLSQLHLH